MSIPSSPINILTFPQRWDPQSQAVDAQHPAAAQGRSLADFAPAFPDASLSFRRASSFARPTSLLWCPPGPAAPRRSGPGRTPAVLRRVRRVVRSARQNRLPGQSPRAGPSASLAKTQRRQEIPDFRLSRSHAIRRRPNPLCRHRWRLRMRLARRRIQASRSRSGPPHLLLGRDPELRSAPAVACREARVCSTRPT